MRLVTGSLKTEGGHRTRAAIALSCPLGGRLTLVETGNELRLTQAEAGKLLGQSVRGAEQPGYRGNESTTKCLTPGCVELRKTGGGTTP